jgi:hypothetical protein
MSAIVLIALSLVCTIIGVYYLVHKKPERAKPIKDATNVQVTVEIGYSYLKLAIYLPAMHFVNNMKKALTKNILQLKSIWQNDKEVLIKLYSKIPLEQRKKFIKSLVDEMRQSLEVYFEKDQFFYSVVTQFEPYGLAFISEAEAEESCSKTGAGAGEEEDDSVIEIKDVANMEREVQAAKEGGENGLRNRKGKEKGKDENFAKSVKEVGKAPAPAAAPASARMKSASSDRLLHMHLSRYFDEIDAVVGKFMPIAVITAENTDELDPDIDTPAAPTGASAAAEGAGAEAEQPLKERPGAKALKEQARVFLEVVRSLVVVMFLHQFLKRYPVDPTEGGQTNSVLYPLLGDKTARVVKAIRFAVFSGLAVVLGMLALQQLGVLDEVFWGLPAAA